MQSRSCNTLHVFHILVHLASKHLVSFIHTYKCHHLDSLQNRICLESQDANSHFMADARSRKSLGNPDAKALLERVAAKGQSNYKHIRSGHNGGAVEKFCNTTASHFAFPNQYNSSITYFLKIAVFLEYERAEEEKKTKNNPIWLQKEAAYGQYSSWWKNQFQQPGRLEELCLIKVCLAFSNHDVAMDWGRFMGWEGGGVACY